MSGSSPLARGLQELKAGDVFTPGIIPARAGFTRVMKQEITVGGDHPRSRGVYVSTSTRWTMMSGSSPLARGLQSTRSYE